MAAQRADTHAQTVNRNGVRGSEDFVGLRLTLPLFAGLAVIQLFVDPRDQATGQRYAKVIHRQLAAAGELSDFTLDIEDRGRRVCQLGSDALVQLAHLGQQLAHMTRAAAGRRLVGRHGDPLHQILREQAAEGHQHQADGAVTANKGFHAVVQAVGDDALVNRVKNNDGIVFHAKRRGRVNPVALPAAFTQLRIDFVGIIAALAGHNNVECLQRFQIVSILQRACGTPKGRCSLAELGSGEEDRADSVEIALFNHALHEYRADHTAPADKTNVFHSIFFLQGVCADCASQY